MSFQTHGVPASPPVGISRVSRGTLGPSSMSGRSSPTLFESEQIPPAKFWCEDIDTHVALVTTDRIAYRVQRDCLESVSRRLQHLIAKASKIVDKESPFGCPTVYLDLPSSRLKPFLEVVADPTGCEKITWLAYSRNSPNAEDCLPFSWLAAVARTAHELGAYHIRFAALTRIRRFFESNAPLQFVKHSKGFQANWAWWGRECGLTVAIEDSVEALNLSRLLLVPFQSPLALYACCLLPPAQLRSGVPREDGGVERLSDEEFERCIHALPSLHMANYRALVKTFAHAEDWKCRGVHPCEGKHSMRRIRDAYMTHMKMPGPYRPDLRDLLSSLKFKSLPYSRLSAPQGSARTLLCRECIERLVDRSETLCCEEAANLEKYFFPEEEEWEDDEEGEGSALRGTDNSDANLSDIPSPGELEARTPPSLEPEPKPDSESSCEDSEPSGSPADTDTEPEATNDSNCIPISSGGPPSESTWTSSAGPESETSLLSRRSASPSVDDDDEDEDDNNNNDNNDNDDNNSNADNVDDDVESDNDDGLNSANDDPDDSEVDDGEADEPRSPVRDCSKAGFSPRLDIEIPPPLSAMIGWDDHAGLDVDLFLLWGS